MSKQSKHAKAIELKKNGFKPIKDRPGFYISITGKAFNVNTGREMPLNRGKYYRFKKENGLEENLTAAKLVLQAFSNIPYRENKQVLFLDGNELNLHPDNLKYAQETFQEIKIDKTALLFAIRCYIPVYEDFKPALNSFYTRFFIDLIALQRLFYNRKYEHIELLKEYLSVRQQSISSIAKIENLSIRDCSNYVNELINILSYEIITDLNKGYLKLHPFTIKETEKQKEKRTISEYHNFIESFKGNMN